LLQKLLQNRNEVIIMYHGLALCSCGERFSDYSDIENHLVQKHEKLSEEDKVSSRKAFSFSDVLKDVINNGGGLSSSVNEAEQLDIALPPKSFAVCLDEESIDGGRIENGTVKSVQSPVGPVGPSRHSRITTYANIIHGYVKRLVVKYLVFSSPSRVGSTKIDCLKAGDITTIVLFLAASII